MTIQRISVVGLGYIGLPTAAVFAGCGVKVLGIDVNPKVIETVNKGEIHIIEPDLDMVVRAAVTEGYLRASLVPEEADAFLIAVPTPFVEENDTNSHEPDLKYIKAACDTIAPVLKPGNLVVLESTSPVGTTEQMAQWLADARPDLTFPQTHGEESQIRIAHCPERVLPGKVLRELVDNDRIVGGMTAKCSAAAVAIYKLFVEGDCIVTDARTAEMCKLTENSFRDVNIAFANELSIICNKLDIDVWELIRLANLHPRVNILQPGPGVGGHCIAVDPWFIVSSAPDEAKLIHQARLTNNAKPHFVLEKIRSRLNELAERDGVGEETKLTVACYGVAFKADIDDLRESPSLGIVEALKNCFSGKIIVVEPNVQDLPGSLSGTQKADGIEIVADLHVFLVGHREFRDLVLPEEAVLDFCGVRRPQK